MSFKIRQGYGIPSAYPEPLIQSSLYFSVSLLPGKPFCGKQVKWNLLFHVFRGTKCVMCVLYIYIHRDIHFIYKHVLQYMYQQIHIFMRTHLFMYTYMCYLACLNIISLRRKNSVTSKHEFKCLRYLKSQFLVLPTVVIATGLTRHEKV